QKMLNRKYPELVRAFEAQSEQSFIADGEIVTFTGEVTSFSKLQQRMQVQNPPAELQKQIPVSFYVFDLLYLSGYDLRQAPLWYRKELLMKCMQFREPLRVTEHRETEGEAFYREACNRHWEGIIAQNGESPSVSGRSTEWRK